jgi:hypothetical protein
MTGTASTAPCTARLHYVRCFIRFPAWPDSITSTATDTIDSAAPSTSTPPSPELHGWSFRHPHPSRADARHLEWCAERLGPAFATGLVIHTGPRTIRLTDRIIAVPIAALWP